jgi:glutaconate CoA-transferase subunit B
MTNEGNHQELLKKYTPMEFACCAAYKYCRDGTNVFVGVGLSLLPAQLAQKTFAPNITIIYEGGTIGSTPVGRVPWCIDDTVIQANAECHTDVLSALGWLAQSGRVDLTFLGAAQVDRFGNINTTLYGADYTKPAARVTGSGGAHDLAIGSRNFVVIMNHKADRIKEKLDYYTSPGFCEGGRSRWDVWGFSGGGPAAIITDLAVLKPNLVTYELEIAEAFPFTNVEEVKKNTGYDIKVAQNFKFTDVPADTEIKIIREVLDTTGDFTGWKKLVADKAAAAKGGA